MAAVDDGTRACRPQRKRPSFGFLVFVDGYQYLYRNVGNGRAMIPHLAAQLSPIRHRHRTIGHGIHHY